MHGYNLTFFYPGALVVLVKYVTSYMNMNEQAPVVSSIGLDMEKKIMAGTWCGKAPLGYYNYRIGKATTIKVDIPKAEKVIRAFHMAAFLPLREVLEQMTQDGLSTKHGKPLTLSSLHKLLTNPFYAGKMRYQGKLYKGNYIPLVTVTMFDKVQKNLRKRRC